MLPLFSQDVLSRIKGNDPLLEGQGVSSEVAEVVQQHCYFRHSDAEIPYEALARSADATVEP